MVVGGDKDSKKKRQSIRCRGGCRWWQKVVARRRNKEETG